MQFTYERECNLCWIADYLTFTKKDNIIHYKEYTGTYEGIETGNTKVNNLIEYLQQQSLTIDNFPGLKDYLKENYSKLLHKLELTEPNYRQLLANLVNDINKCYYQYSIPYKFIDSYKAACLALDPDSYDFE